MTDFASDLVIGFEVAASATDVGTLIPLIDKVQPLVGGSIKRAVTDATYATVLELMDCHDRDSLLYAKVKEAARPGK